jgi:serine/threonine protein kinase
MRAVGAPDAKNPRAAEALRALISKMVAEDPAQRPSAEQALRELTASDGAEKSQSSAAASS